MVREYFKITEENTSDYDFAIANATTLSDAQHLLKNLEEFIGHAVNYPVFQIGVTIGSYTGPGGIGISFIKNMIVSEGGLTMTPKKLHYENLADSIIEKFNKRGFEGYYCETAEEALLTAKRFLTPGCSISWGGSETLCEIGLLDELRASDYIIYDRNTPKTPEEKALLYSKVVMSDYYFMSSNAITIDGHLLNIDGHGNRVACLITGPKNVIVIAGMNKIETDIPSGIDRIRTMASPANAVRMGLKTPCAELGKCVNCLSDDCICCEVVITRKSRIPGRIKVILVGEELGF
jgi:hypothetical protein